MVVTKSNHNSNNMCAPSSWVASRKYAWSCFLLLNCRTQNLQKLSTPLFPGDLSFVLLSTIKRALTVLLTPSNYLKKSSLTYITYTSALNTVLVRRYSSCCLYAQNSSSTHFEHFYHLFFLTNLLDLTLVSFSFCFIWYRRTFVGSSFP